MFRGFASDFQGSMDFRWMSDGCPMDVGACYRTSDFMSDCPIVRLPDGPVLVPLRLGLVHELQQKRKKISQFDQICNTNVT